MNEFTGSQRQARATRRDIHWFGHVSRALTEIRHACGHPRAWNDIHEATLRGGEGPRADHPDRGGGDRLVPTPSATLNRGL